MKIVNRKEFLKLPENTVFCKYEPMILHEVCIRGEAWDIDFFYKGLNEIDADGIEERIKQYALMEKGGSVRMDFEIMSRDGLFEENQLFAVFEKEDVKQLIERLKKCV